MNLSYTSSKIDLSNSAKKAGFSQIRTYLCCYAFSGKRVKTTARGTLRRVTSRLLQVARVLPSGRVPLRQNHGLHHGQVGGATEHPCRLARPRHGYLCCRRLPQVSASGLASVRACIRVERLYAVGHETKGMPPLEVRLPPKI